MTTPILLLGAGFNVDAADAAGMSSRRYPLVADLVQQCFGSSVITADSSVEELFQEAIQRNDLAPLKTMADALMEADYHIGTRLNAQSTSGNIYTRFFNAFRFETIITFNYDSLVELILFRDGQWVPEDGYGVTARAERFEFASAAHPVPVRSNTRTLHVHGTLCVYAQEYGFTYDPQTRINMMDFKSEPEFIFDADSISDCFLPYRRIPPQDGYEYIESRIIAPVPSKAAGLTRAFILDANRLAREALRARAPVISVGYRFNPADRDSYHALIGDLIDTDIAIILPEAHEVAIRLRTEYPAIRWHPLPFTFAQWANLDYVVPWAVTPT